MKKCRFTVVSAMFGLAFFSFNESALAQGRAVAKIEQAKAQLIVGPETDAGTVQAIVSIEMADGFKTYWHVPGDGGLPPLFKVDGEPVEVRLPAPTRFKDQYGQSIGYKAEVTMAFELPAPTDGVVDMDMIVGVCAEICIPFIANLSAPVPPAMMPRAKFAIADAFDALPGAFDDELSVTDATVSTGEDGALDLVANIVVPSDAGLEDARVFAWLPGRDEFFVHAAQLTRDGKMVAARMPVTTELSPEILAGREVQFTLISADQSVEGVVKLH
ncbi:MAG: protein-disulfide reductase DsbD domain-containing protein [Pseudomonadota bacterium]